MRSPTTATLLPSYVSGFVDEKQRPQSHLPSRPESARCRDSPAFWLVLYFCFNLGLTLYNKGILVRFPFPYTLSAIHALFGTVGALLLVARGAFVPTRPDSKQLVTIVAFSVLYTINIAVSNVSLELVTVPFHQVVRGMTPMFTLLLSAMLFGVQSSRSKQLSLLPIVLGVGLATFGDYYFTPYGFFLTLIGTLLAALKTIYTHVLQSSPETMYDCNNQSRYPRFTNPLDMLLLLSPLAFVQCVLLAFFTGELSRVQKYSSHEMSVYNVVALSLNGCIAFGLNVVSLSANRRVGALGMTIAANVKQVLTILCAVFVFNLTITMTNGAGILVTLAGGAWYARVDFSEKRLRLL